LTYVEIGLLLSVPGLFSNFIEPIFGILSDVWNRRALILGGGIMFGVAIMLAAISQSFWPLLVAFILLFPASGAFVSLSQAALMDDDPTRHEQNMARWTLAGSLGVVAGPLALGAVVVLGSEWRGLLLVLAGLAVLLTAAAWRFPFPNNNGHNEDDEELTFIDGLKNAVRALRRRDVARWLILLQFSDLMLDILYSFLALYFVDVVGVSVEEATLAVAVWTGVGLVGDALLIPLLERMRGLDYLRLSAGIQMGLFPAFLIVEPFGLKLVLLGLLGLLNSGWYAILQAQLYSALPGQSGVALAMNNVGGLAGSLIPMIIGAVAQAAGLDVAIWLMLEGPVALLVGLPRRTAPTMSRDP